MFFGQNSEFLNLLMMKTVGNNGHLDEATLTNVNHSLKELAKIVKKKKIKSLAIPKLATGLRT